MQGRKTKPETPLSISLFLTFSLSCFLSRSLSSFIIFLYICFSLTKKLVTCFCECLLLSLPNIWWLSVLPSLLQVCFFVLFFFLQPPAPLLVCSVGPCGCCTAAWIHYFAAVLFSLCPYLSLLSELEILALSLTHTLSFPPDACQVFNCRLLKAPLSSLLPTC